MPDGEAYYGWLLKQGTNTTLTAEEVHQMGLDNLPELPERFPGGVDHFGEAAA
ncbi:MAG: hypothetical protein ABI743_13025 [bacterium]